MIVKNGIHPLWQGTSDAQLFEHLKVSENKAHVRRYFENLYDSLASKNLVDKHFDNAFRKQIPQRWWELFTGNWLLSQPMATNLSAHSEGPDFCIDHCGQKCWIECVAPWPKNEAERIDRQLPQMSLACLNSSDFILSITSGIKEKSEKFAQYQKRNIVAADDFKIIALSMTTACNIDILEDNDTPILFQSLLGLGPQAIRVPVGEGLGEHEFERVQTQRSIVPKKNGSGVPTNSFLSGIHGNISGVLYSIHRYVDCPDPETTDLMFLHNPTATVPLPRGIFNRINEYAAVDGYLVRVDTPDKVELKK